MALVINGPDFELKRVDATGKFDWDMVTSGPGKGNPRLGSSRTHAVMATIHAQKRGKRPGDKTESGGYYWDTTDRRGTLLWTVTQDRNSTRSQLIACSQDGLQQLQDERYILSFPQPDAGKRSAGRWWLTVPWKPPSSEPGAQPIQETLKL